LVEWLAIAVVRLDLADALAAPGRGAVVHPAQLPTGEWITCGDAGRVPLTRLLGQGAGVDRTSRHMRVSVSDTWPRG
jgi:hypothetical protein